MTIHRRRTIRLPERDYSKPGNYWVTICSRDRESIFGHVVSGCMERNALGDLVLRDWFAAVPLRHWINLLPDEVVIMPNHLHAIVRMLAPPSDETPDRPLRSRSLGALVRAFKTVTTRRATCELGLREGESLWQRNYFERVVREGGQIERIRGYIAANPSLWDVDPENPVAR